MASTEGHSAHITSSIHQRPKFLLVSVGRGKSQWLIEGNGLVLPVCKLLSSWEGTKWSILPSPLWPLKWISIRGYQNNFLSKIIQGVHQLGSLKKKKASACDVPDGPLVKNLPCSAEEAGSIPGQGTKIPHATGQLSPCSAARKSVCGNKRSCMTQGWSQLPQRRPKAVK